MLQEKRAIPTYVSNFVAYNDVMHQLCYCISNTMDWSKDPVKETLLDILKKAIMDYEKNPMDVCAVSTINVFVSYLDSVYSYHRGLRSDVHDILKSHFISDRVIEPVVAWKKACRFDNAPIKGVLVKLEIPAGARIVRHLFSNKCRTDKAKVLDITSFDGTERLSHAHSHFDTGFKYTVGDIIVPKHDPFDERPWIKCSEGIHFFETKEEAIEYDFS